MATVRPTAAALRKALAAVADPKVAAKVAGFYKGETLGNRVMGVDFGKNFATAKTFVAMPLEDVETLLEDAHYEVRMAAMAILDFKAQTKGVSDAERKALFDLYLRRHDRIDNWDLVDRAAPRVVGGWLAGRSKAPLTKLAKSRDPWERRTAIVATYAFIREGEIEETFRIGELLAGDAHPYVQMAVASWVREAGKRDQPRLVEFLTRNAKRLKAKSMRDASKLLPANVRAGVMAAAKA